MPTEYKIDKEVLIHDDSGTEHQEWIDALKDTRYGLVHPKPQSPNPKPLTLNPETLKSYIGLLPPLEVL